MIPLADLGGSLTGLAAIGMLAIAAVGVIRSWRKGPADAMLSEAQARNETDRGWMAKLEVERAATASAKADAAHERERRDLIQTQVDALRVAKDEQEIALKRLVRDAEHARDEAEAEAEDHERRIARLVTQLRTLGFPPTA